MLKLSQVTRCAAFMLFASVATFPALGQQSTPAQPAQQQQTQPNTQLLVDNVSKMVETLRENIASLDQGIQTSDNALKNAPKILDDLLKSVEEINGSIAEDSETWKELSSLIDRFEGERARVAKRANETGNAQLQNIAGLWQEKVAKAGSLRDDISRERARSQALINELRDNREVVIELVKLDAADLVIKNMQAIRDNLVSVNDDMQVMLDKAKELDSGAVQN